MLAHEKTDEGMWHELIERDFSRLVYVVRLGRNYSPMEFMCEEMDCHCRYHMRYTIGYERMCGDGAPLEAYFRIRWRLRRIS